MILRSAQFIFPGTPNHKPIEWGVEYSEDGVFVVESYDGGQSWITNTDMPTVEAAIAFIRAWFEGQ